MPKKGSKKKPEEEGAVEVKKEEPDVAAAPDAVAAGVKREREEENGGGSNSKQVKAESSKVEPRCVMIVRRIPSAAASVPYLTPCDGACRFLYAYGLACACRTVGECAELHICLADTRV